MQRSRIRFNRLACTLICCVGVVLVLSLSAGAKGKHSAKHGGPSGKFVSFAKQTLVLEMAGNQLQTFNVPDKTPVDISGKAKEVSMSPGAFVGVPKRTKIEIAVDGSGIVSHATIVHPDYKKR